MKSSHPTLEGKFALVTGAGSGIGRATAQLMAECGAKVALLGRTLADLEKTLSHIGGSPSGHFTLEADVGD